MNEIEETVLIKIPGYEELYSFNKETNQVYSMKRKTYLKGWLNTGGYLQVKLYQEKKSKFYLLHRLIFLVHHIYLPTIIDHVDGNRTNNSIDNVREATHSQNAMNSKLPSNNTSGFKGIGKYICGWKSDIMYNGKGDQKYFKLKSEAIEYNRMMRESFHGEYKREN